MFAVNETANWGYAGFKATSRAAVQDRIDEAFRLAYEPLFAGLNTPEALLEMLLREEPPFKWAASAVFGRIVQIAHLIGITKGDARHARNVIARNWKYMKSDARLGASEVSLFDELCAAAVRDR